MGALLLLAGQSNHREKNYLGVVFTILISLPVRKKRGRNRQKYSLFFKSFIQVHIFKSFLGLLSFTEHIHQITYLIWFLPTKLIAGFLKQKVPLMEWTQTIKQKSAKVDHIGDWVNMASFCRNTAVMLENDFSVFPSEFHSAVCTFVNMSNRVMEVNDNVGFRNCCLEITLT